MNKRSNFCSRPAAGVLLAALLLGPWQAAADSLWREDSPINVFGDKRARAIGDILTIIIQESASSSKDNSTKTARSSKINASIDTFLYPPGTTSSAISKLLTKGGSYPALKLTSANDYNGGGQVSNSEQITARVTVRVVDVLPNGHLTIEGRRNTEFASEKQQIILRGVVRPDDIAANNTVYSYNVADVTISMTQSGTVTDSQRKPWFLRIWEKIAPF